MKRENPYKQKKRQTLPEPDFQGPENAQPNIQSNSQILIQDQQQQYPYDNTTHGQSILESVNETPKTKAADKAFDYSDHKEAVKIELDPSASEPAVKVNSFNRFKKQERKRSPLIEVVTPDPRPSQCSQGEQVANASHDVDFEAKYKALLRESTQQRRVLTKLQTMMQKREQEHQQDLEIAKNQMAEEFTRRQKESEEEIQLIMSNQEDHHKDEMSHQETQLAELRERVRILEESETLLKAKVQRKKAKIEAVRKDQDEAVVSFQRYLAEREEENAQLKKKLEEIQSQLADLQRVSMVTAKMGPVSERFANEAGFSDHLNSFGQSKVQNVVIQQRLNENDLDRLGSRQVARRDSQQSQGFLAMTRYMCNSRSGSQKRGATGGGDLSNFNLTQDYAINKSHVIEHTRQAEATHQLYRTSDRSRRSSESAPKSTSPPSSGPKSNQSQTPKRSMRRLSQREGRPPTKGQITYQNNPLQQAQKHMRLKSEPDASKMLPNPTSNILIENQLDQHLKTYAVDPASERLGPQQKTLATKIDENNAENATPDSRLLNFSPEQEKVVNKSVLLSIRPEEAITVQNRFSLTSANEGDCHIADEVMGLSVHSKAINTSYINLKRNNVLQTDGLVCSDSEK